MTSKLTRLLRARPTVLKPASRSLVSTTCCSSLILARDWISESLYSLEHGYFNTAASPVGQLPDPLPFQQLAGQQAYLQTLRLWYDKLQVSWLTPAEIFRPFYGHALAVALLEKLPPKQPLDIIEVGGGSGRLARDVLDYLHDHHQEQYARTSYTSFEISPKLAEVQRQKVLYDGKHRSCYKVAQHDASAPLAWGAVNEQPCVIMLMEVLDNLPHDRVWRQSSEADWQETWIQSSSPASHDHMQQKHVEVTKPVADPLVWACLEASQLQPRHLSQSCLHATLDWALGQVSPSGSGSGQTIWLPTSCLQLLQRICAARPNHVIIAADFDELPDVTVPGQGAPLVASTINGQTLDHPSYLVPQGTADIFFPTDFQLLQSLHHLANQGHGGIQGQVMKTKAFMKQYADLTTTLTKSGYNPLLQDFSNTSFYVGSAGSCSQQ
ncbi:hypothetical protein WJX77_009984 [Trebouxia sp. C0004]